MVVVVVVVVVVVTGSSAAQVPQVLGHLTAATGLTSQPGPMVRNRQPAPSLHSSCLSNFCSATVPPLSQTVTTKSTDARCNMLLDINEWTDMSNRSMQAKLATYFVKVNYSYSHMQNVMLTVACFWETILSV